MAGIVCLALVMPLGLLIPSEPAMEDDSINLTKQNTEDIQPIRFPPSTLHQGGSPQVYWQQYNPPDQSGLYSCIQLYDFNLDGKLDMVAGNSNGGISMWTGDGVGNWAVFSPPTTSLDYYDFAFGDINNDGIPDMVAGYDRGMLAWISDGAGTWIDITNGLPNEYLGPLFPIYSVVLDDMDLDGNLDIIGGNNGKAGAQPIQAIRVFLGDGNGAWTDASSNLPSINGLKYFGVATGDFNNDGWPDIAGAGSNGVDAWIGNGGSTWILRDIGLPSIGAYSDVKFADFNIDGNLDIVASGKNNNGMAVSNGDGWGVWTTTYTLPLSDSYTSVEVSDVNIDGYMDIIASSDNSPEHIWTGDGQNNWYSQINGLRPGDSHVDISIGDIDNDARVDMCLLNTTGEHDVWSSEVDRSVNAWAELNPPASSGQINDIEIADINKDGKLDICYAMEGGGIELWAGDGTGNWTALTSPITTGNYNSLISLDFNKDGILDIVSTSDAGLKAWSGDGGSAWVLLPPGCGLPSAGTFLGLVSADFNNDGNPDIAAGSDSSGVAVWNGNGLDYFEMKFNLPFSGTYYDLEAGDINHDGAIDLVAADGGLKTFLGDAIDGWTESSGVLPDNTNQYYSVEITDLNNDGKLDIVGASESTGVNTWLGDGTGAWTFDSNVISEASTGLAVGDFSIDGSKDIIAGSSLDTGLNGNQQITGSWNTVSDGLFLSGDFTTMELVDINIDGRLDIITANYTAGTPHIWVGEYIPPPPVSYSIGPLQVGWNMISMPLIPGDTSLPDALIDLDGDTSWTRVKCYSPIDAMNPWKSYSSLGSPSVQDVFSIENTKGAWIYIPDAISLGDGFIRVEGQEPDTTGITLKAGWNLIGYPSSVDRLASDALPGSVDMIAVYDGLLPAMIRDETDLSTVTMSAGNAYWIHVNADIVWDLDW